MCWDCLIEIGIADKVSAAVARRIDQEIFDRLRQRMHVAGYDPEAQRARERSLERLRALSRPRGYLLD